MNRPLLSVAVVLLVVTTSCVAQAAKLPPTLKVGQQELVLNGEGLRQKYMLDLYVAGLYLKERNQQAQAVIDADQLMAIRIVITSKFVSQEKMLASLQEGFQRSTGGNLKSIQTQTEQFKNCFGERIVRGDVFDLVYVPQQGVMIFKNGKKKGIATGLPFKQALFGIWLGERPADPKLKLALLGTDGAAIRR